VDEFGGRVAFLEFDPTHDGLEEVAKDRLRGNLVIPRVWEEGIERGCSLVADEGPGILVLVSHSTKHPFRIYLRIERMPGVAYSGSEVKLPIASDTLEEIRTVADYSRKRIIPQVSEI